MAKYSIPSFNIYEKWTTIFHGWKLSDGFCWYLWQKCFVSFSVLTKKRQTIFRRKKIHLQIKGFLDCRYAGLGKLKYFIKTLLHSIEVDVWNCGGTKPQKKIIESFLKELFYILRLARDKYQLLQPNITCISSILMNFFKTGEYFLIRKIIFRNWKIFF
jgi:hypothetical protein